MRAKHVILGIATVSGIAGCDSMLENSKYNTAQVQMSSLKTADIANQPAFKVDLPHFLSRQLMQLDGQIAAKSGQPMTDSPCQLGQSDAVTALAQADLYSSAIQPQLQMQLGKSLANDAVIMASVSTILAGVPQYRTAALNISKPLGFSDFQNFRNRVSDAANPSGPEFGEMNTINTETAPTGEAGILANLFSEPLAGPDSSNVQILAYIGNYYHGTFADRFGNVITKPSFSHGVDDATITNFVRVLVEATADSLPVHDPVLWDGKNTFYPKGNGTAPTFFSFFHKATDATSKPGFWEVVVQPSTTKSTLPGVTANESKLIEAGSNFIADQGLTLFGGILESLGSVDIGIVISPNFTIGGNGTLRGIAQTVIETSLRRGAEIGLYCLVEKYDLEKVASVINDLPGAGKKP